MRRVVSDRGVRKIWEPLMPVKWSAPAVALWHHRRAAVVCCHRLNASCCVRPAMTFTLAGRCSLNFGGRPAGDVKRPGADCPRPDQVRSWRRPNARRCLPPGRKLSLKEGSAVARASARLRPTP